MNPIIKRKTIWMDQRVDNEENTFRLRRSKTFSMDKPEQPAETSCELEITSPRKDDLGRPVMERKVINVTAEVVEGINEAARAIQFDSTKASPSEATVQLHAEAVPGELSVIYEILPFARGEGPIERYVIATPDEKARFIVGDPENMGEIRFKLESWVK
jgi:hypothetical protein